MAVDKNYSRILFSCTLKEDECHGRGHTELRPNRRASPNERSALCPPPPREVVQRSRGLPPPLLENRASACNRIAPAVAARMGQAMERRSAERCPAAQREESRSAWGPSRSPDETAGERCLRRGARTPGRWSWPSGRWTGQALRRRSDGPKGGKNRLWWAGHPGRGGHP